MAEENKLNAKIQLRNDSLENWNKNPTVILQQGEVGFVEIPGNNASTPTILFKVGDGKTQFAKLPWVTALAADVYAWAKAENKPTYTASEVGVTEANFPGLNKTGTVTSIKINGSEKTPTNGVVDLGNNILTVDSSTLTKDHLINWATVGIEDSGIDKSKVAQTDKANVFTKYQTMPGLRLTGTDTEDRTIEFVHSNSNISSFRVNGSWTDNNFSFSGYGRADLKFPGRTVSNILLDNNIKTINNTSLYDTEKGNISIPVVTASTTAGSTGLSYIKIDDTIYNIIDSNSANYAKLNSANIFTQAQRFNEIEFGDKTDKFLGINYVASSLHFNFANNKTINLAQTEENANILTDNNIRDLYAEASDINALFGITSTIVSENTTASENTVVRE